MVTITFSRFHFTKQDDNIICRYGKRYVFTLPFSDFSAIDSEVTFLSDAITFPHVTEKTAENKLNRLLLVGLHNMKHVLTGKQVLFIDESSKLPLLGSGEFGIVDRNTNVLEVKPLTGCNLNCIYCSVNQGINDARYDVLIEPEYIASECARLAQQKSHPVEFNIGPHGEPLLYPFLADLISQLAAIPNCNVISLNTNGTMLSQELINTLKEAGLSRINLSLNTLDAKLNNTLSGRAYPTQHVLDMITYCKEINMPLLLAPLIVPTYNDDPKRDIAPLVKLAKTISSPYPTIGFQKFLSYKGGRNPAPEVSFDKFNALLAPFETDELILTPKKDYNPFNIYEDITIPKPMKKHDVVKARVALPGIKKQETLCVAHHRVITVRGLLTQKKSANIKIIRDKHNIYVGVPA